MSMPIYLEYSRYNFIECGFQALDYKEHIFVHKLTGIVNYPNIHTYY